MNILAGIFFFSAPSGAPTGVSVTALSDTAIVVQWMPPELFERNGPIVSYHTNLTHTNGTRQQYTSSGNTFSLQIEGMGAQHAQVSSTWESKFCSGLPKCAVINITVAAMTRVGVGPSSQPVSVPVSTQTCGARKCMATHSNRSVYALQTVPEAPSAVKADIVNKVNVRLSWSPPASPDRELLGFQIIYYGFKVQNPTELEVSCVTCCLLCTLSVFLQDTKRNVEPEIIDGPNVILVPADEATYVVESLNPELSYTFIVSQNSWIQNDY